MQDSKEVAERPLDCFLYHILGKQIPYDLHYDNLEAAKSWGFKVPAETECCKDIDAVIRFVQKWISYATIYLTILTVLSLR